MRVRKIVVGLTVLLVAIFATPPSVIAAPPPLTGGFMQVVAHQDDDLLFMNPDLHATIRARRPVTTVYLTAGENVNAPHAPSLTRCREKGYGTHDSRAHYAQCRQLGERAAYARMAGVPNVWGRQAVTVAAGDRTVSVDVDTLAGSAAPVALVYLNVPEKADTNADTKPDAGPVPPGNALKAMYDQGAIRRTIVPTGSTATARVEYDRGRLVATLGGLYQHFKPTVVRVQDIEPDYRYRPDHDDHVYAARFAVEALRTRYHARVQLVAYRDYNIANSQVNLEPNQISAKQEVFNTYRGYDEHVGDTGKHRDYDVTWPSRQNHRWWGGTDWVGRNLDGRLQAFTVVDGRLLTWSQTADGGWQGPDDLGNPGYPLAPGVSVARNQDGRLQVFGLRLDTFETVTTSQSQANGSWSAAWAGIGNPNAGRPITHHVGTPAVTANQDGRLQVFAKNGGGGVSTSYQTTPNGSFSPWVDLRGEGAQDGLAVTTNPQGRIEVFAYAIVGNVGRITHWEQPVANQSAGFTLDAAFTAYEPSGPPTVATNADGRLDVFYRLATNGTNNGPKAAQVGHTAQATVGSWRNARAEIISGHGGIGPVAAASAPSSRDGSTTIGDARIMLFQHNRDGGISMTRQVQPNAGYATSWVGTGGFIANEPAVEADASGRMVAFAISGDGRLMISSQTGAEGAAPFTDWSIVG